MDYNRAKQGYLNLWAKAEITPSRAPAARAIAKRLLENKARYQKIAAESGNVPWWWIAAIHNMESNANFNTYLGNGQRLSQVTTIVPKGRGPFPSFEHGAIDALQLKKLSEIEEWDISRALFEAERWNGWGYLGKINSPYLWSFTNLQQPGKYVRDHVWDPKHVSTQCGVAAIFKALEEMGELEFAVEIAEDGMAELKASLLPFGALAPILIKTLAGPAANLAVKAIAEAFDDDDKPEPKPEAVQKRLEEVPLKKMPDILASAEEVLKAVLGVQPEADRPPAQPSLPMTVGGEQASPSAQVVVQPVPVPAAPPTIVVSPAKEDELGVVDKTFGGKWLAGLKTPAGILIYCAAWAASSLGYLSPDVTSALYALATALTGIGITAKIDKFLPWLASVTAVIKK